MIGETVNKKLQIGIGTLALLLAGTAIAQRDVSPRRHPNLAAAQRLIGQAMGRLTAAQQANEYDMEGHAAKAKELLEQADREIKAAAEAANRH